jgi:hypothetical protein
MRRAPSGIDPLYAFAWMTSIRASPYGQLRTDHPQVKSRGVSELARISKSVADLIRSEGSNYRANRDKINHGQIMTC